MLPNFWTQSFMYRKLFQKDIPSVDVNINDQLIGVDQRSVYCWKFLLLLELSKKMNIKNFSSDKFMESMHGKILERPQRDDQWNERLNKSLRDRVAVCFLLEFYHLINFFLSQNKSSKEKKNAIVDHKKKQCFTVLREVFFNWFSFHLTIVNCDI